MQKKNDKHFPVQWANSQLSSEIVIERREEAMKRPASMISS